MITDYDSGVVLETLGSRIARARLRCGLSQEQLGMRVGLSRPSIANLEAGRQDITVTRLSAVARYLRVSVGELLD